MDLAVLVQKLLDLPEGADLGSTSITGFVTPNCAAAARPTACAVRPTESLITWMVGRSPEFP